MATIFHPSEKAFLLRSLSEVVLVWHRGTGQAAFNLAVKEGKADLQLSFQLGHPSDTHVQPPSTHPRVKTLKQKQRDRDRAAAHQARTAQKTQDGNPSIVIPPQAPAAPAGTPVATSTQHQAASAETPAKTLPMSLAGSAGTPAITLPHFQAASAETYIATLPPTPAASTGNSATSLPQPTAAPASSTPGAAPAPFLHAASSATTHLPQIIAEASTATAPTHKPSSEPAEANTAKKDSLAITTPAPHKQALPKPTDPLHIDHPAIRTLPPEIQDELKSMHEAFKQNDLEILFQHGLLSHLEKKGFVYNAVLKSFFSFPHTKNSTQ